ncbi:hypothetical protein SAMD00019534_105530 [Acytostelium subglobosum LB1]|uniref:hypothetical protein n=1 Tax=Acytostelium subglobosum LB1 TaxID=1410327 RepID=UPI0006449053|nr:hypothetical protein SAMD00019534_105530 [Acytostelium subglobosum LB1]GAM27378.1 hypothetical protein SAMD00019534_105530 [Acytostelium subglobosum LB1]|eukprot:XP_012749845.1 hypothetical protein SAMD00019534_105530 [Acytostelium subglobosum LB1]
MTKTKRPKPHLKKPYGTPTVTSHTKKDSTTDDDQSMEQVEKSPQFVIDGSILEGGGQILRNCVALSSLYSKPILIEKIRHNRDQPGLKAQHKAGIDLVARMFRAHLDGSKQGSVTLYYHPRISPSLIKEHDIEADTGTAGSITLLIQVSMPCLLFAPHSIKLTLGGGTNVDFSPAADYLQHVFFPAAKRFGIDVDMEIKKRGYYPKGGGLVTLITRPIIGTLQPITIMNKGNLTKITIRVNFTSTRISIQVAERMLTAAKKMIKKDYKKVEIVEDIVDTAKYTFGDGVSIFIMAETDTGCIYGGSANGAIGIPAEEVGETAAISVLNDLLHGGCMDEYLQDQLIIFMALAKGKSQIKTGPLSLHTQTSIHFSTMLTGCTFTVTPAPDRQRGEETFIIACDGIGYISNQPQPGGVVVAAETAPTTSTTSTTSTTTTTTTTS